MSSYVRPSIDALVFRATDGTVIDYGNRWSDSPPEDAYSVDTNLERFAPLHIIAEALVAHLATTYDVEIDDDTEAREPPSGLQDVIRTVQIRPADPNSAAVHLVFTTYPGILLRAGLLHDFVHPACGCDACDSTWHSAADELERQVLAIASGNYRETIERGPRPWVAHTFTYPDGWSSGRTRAQDFPAERLAKAKPILRRLPDGWAPWPRRASDA